LPDPTSDRSHRLRAAITERLERIRSRLTEAEFAELVGDVARTAERFERLELREYDRMVAAGILIKARSGESSTPP
jgi:hypothetical protein